MARPRRDDLNHQSDTGYHRGKLNVLRDQLHKKYQKGMQNECEQMQNDVELSLAAGAGI